MEDNKEIGLDKKDGSSNEVKETVDEKPFHYKHARANIAVDMVVFGVLPKGNNLYVFVQKNKPDSRWSLPGRFMHCGVLGYKTEVDEEDNWTLEDTRKDALKRTWPIKTIFKNADDESNNYIIKESENYTIKENSDLIVQLEAMSRLDRDSRKKRVVSIPYMTLVRIDTPIPPILNNFAAWMPLEMLMSNPNCLDHDHREILENGLRRLFQEVRTRPIGINIVTKEVNDENSDNHNDENNVKNTNEVFDISNLIRIYNAILSAMGVSVERSNMRKLLLDRGVIEVVCAEKPSGKGMDCKFDKDKYDEYKRYHNFGFNPKVSK